MVGDDKSKRIYVSKQLAAYLQKAYPGWRFGVQEMTFPAQGSFGTVVKLQDRAVKAVFPSKNDDAYRQSILFEQWVLRALTLACQDERALASEFLRVNIPTYMEPAFGAFGDSASRIVAFAMDHIPGNVWKKNQAYSTHPVVVEQFATCFVRMDQVLHKIVACGPVASSDSLDLWILESLKEHREKYFNRNPGKAINGLDHASAAKGAAWLVKQAPWFSQALKTSFSAHRRLASDDLGRERFFHGDFHGGNALLDAKKNRKTGELISVQAGVLDFGLMDWSEPHAGMARMFAKADNATLGLLWNVFTMVNEISERETGAPWVNLEASLALAPLFIAAAAERLAAYERYDIDGRLFVARIRLLERAHALMPMFDLHPYRPGGRRVKNRKVVAKVA